MKRWEKHRKIWKDIIWKGAFALRTYLNITSGSGTVRSGVLLARDSNAAEPQKAPETGRSFFGIFKIHWLSRETKIGVVKRQNQSGFNAPTECEDHFIPHMSFCHGLFRTLWLDQIWVGSRGSFQPCGIHCLQHEVWNLLQSSKLLKSFWNAISGSLTIEFKHPPVSRRIRLWYERCILHKWSQIQQQRHQVHFFWNAKARTHGCEGRDVTIVVV